MTTNHGIWILALLAAACGGGPETSNDDTAGASSAASTGAGPGSTDTGGSATASATTSSGTETTDSPTSATLTSLTDSDGPCGGAPVFETDIVPILTASCGANDNACHSRVAYAAAVDSECRGWLALEDVPLGAMYYSGPMEGQATGCSDMDLYTRLVQLDAWQCEQFDPRVRYVVPCKPEDSYIVQKMGGGPYCMLSADTPSQPMPLGKPVDPDERAIIEAWIAAGAPRLADACPIDCDGPDPGTTGGTTDATTDGTTTDVGQAPVAEIYHPGDGEVRPVDVDIPFIGVGNDVEDGMLGGSSLVWTSDLEGQIGVGENFNAPLTVVGMHTITLTATDSADNQGVDAIVLDIQ